MKQFTWSGKLKIIVEDDIKRKKILKKHPSLDLNVNNKRYPTNIRVTYNKSQKKFLNMLLKQEQKTNKTETNP